MKKYLVFIILFSVFLCKTKLAAQDSLKLQGIVLPDFIVKAQKDPEYEKKYQRLVYNVKKVLPYAKMASFRFQKMEQNIQLLTNAHFLLCY
jgi:hypothetical protein